ncbi:RNA polymerase RpoN-/SigL-like sigma 54 subunit [Mesorhizobium sp. J18]|uniref:RNA polymerase factor sigma-54 n=1 Tax=Mesorhizobium sp. J18 TaxID=935263 RepID=UPI00119B54F0|nr:RNA polymerase factor sigma-54 [Mesorhizobium sp. J18]TWG91322.1 RNA polymerase RpoN-/SigL-like sigma 54 subunit [Mesorhizobium sp. J18]
MALQAKLHLRQTQSLVMTPQLMQSIRLLQLTHIELERFIDEEIESNPLLDRAEPEDQIPVTAEEQQAGPDWHEGSDADWTSESIAARLDSSLENLFPDDPGIHDSIGPDLSAQWKSAGLGMTSASGQGFEIEEVATAPVTLQHHVAEQIAFAPFDPTQRIIAHALADELDEAGYMTADPGELAERIGADRHEVHKVLQICQTFEPSGLFARNLAECLALQLHARDRFDPAMEALVSNLELLARRDFQALRRICGVDEEDLLDMLSEIRALDPKPGTAFAGCLADPVVPDVIVRPAGDGTWAVELNPETLPRVLVDHTYFATASAHASHPERQYLSECLQNANWLARSLDQRARTILKVATEIVRQQDAFLVHGIRHLRPLNLRMIAEAIGMHESTVSRVTANKYMMTPRGIFELRYFFSTAISSAEGGDAHSSEAVRDRIRQLINEEDAEGVLSDDSIVDILRKSGVDIARRTVAKYREGMNIPSSVQRRREKRALSFAER